MGIGPLVNNPQGQAEQWAIEMGGPAGLARQGWKESQRPSRDGTSCTDRALGSRRSSSSG
jgi:hypothetical protein